MWKALWIGSSSLVLVGVVACSGNVSLGDASNALGRTDGGRDSGGGSTDPCSGVSLPECPPECTPGIQPGESCATAGETCGNEIGDSCVCDANGMWSCAIHAPLGEGCNLVCRRGGGSRDGGVQPPTRDAGVDGAPTADAGLADPCDGVPLPACPRECSTFPERGACTDGDVCRAAGSKIGDECRCSGGVWGCSIHPPLGTGCNLVCR
jgi:hypothetical protein